MVITFSSRRVRSAFLTMDLLFAMALFLFGFFGIAYVSTRELHLARADYYDAVAMSLVDGELEVLANGEWQTLPEGASSYRSTAPTMKALPPGEFRATRTRDHIQLEWIPAGKGNGRHIIRAFNLSPSTTPSEESKR